jgi:hypothetical protein
MGSYSSLSGGSTSHSDGGGSSASQNEAAPHGSTSRTGTKPKPATATVVKK